jgi:hypothetical protein
MADGRPPEIHVKTVIVRQLTLTVRQISEAPPEVKEERVGVDPRFASKVELDPVACPEIDEFGEAGEPSQLDQILPWELCGQCSRRELIHVHGPIRGADDADPIQTQCLPAGFYDTTRRDSATKGP